MMMHGLKNFKLVLIFYIVVWTHRVSNFGNDYV